MSTVNLINVQKTEVTTKSEWQNLFASILSTYTGSKLFLKQLTIITFSCVTHVRGMFPEEAYSELHIGGKAIKVLNGLRTCKKAFFMTELLKRSFEGIDCENIKQLVLEIISPDNKPIEYYVIDYKYGESGTSFSFSSSNEQKSFVSIHNSDIENATSELIFNLHNLVNSWSPLPNAYKLQLRIFYVDNIKPESNCPQYFTPSVAFDWSTLPGIRKCCFGNVQTNFQLISMNGGKVINEINSLSSKTSTLAPTIILEKEQLNSLSGSDREKRTSSLNALQTIDFKQTKKLNNNQRNPPKDENKHIVWCSKSTNSETSDALGNSWNSDNALNLPLHQFDDYSKRKEIGDCKRKNLSIIEEEEEEENADKHSKTHSDESIEIKKFKPLKTTEHHLFKVEEGEHDNIQACPSEIPLPPKEENLTFAVDLSHSENSSAIELRKYFSQQILRDGIKVKCICRSELKDESVFLCQYCQRFQHMVCYKIWPTSPEPTDGCCYFCAKLADVKCSDIDLKKYEEEQLVERNCWFLSFFKYLFFSVKKNLAKYRQLLYKMQWYKTINKELLMNNFNISESLVGHVIKKLLEEGFILQSKTNNFKIAKTCLQLSINEYFNHY